MLVDSGTSVWASLNEKKMGNDERDYYITLTREFLTEKIRKNELDFNNEDIVARKLIEYLVNNAKINYQKASEIADYILIDIRGYGPIDPLVKDPNISDIFIHDYNDITYEKLGKKHTWNQGFRDRQHLMMFIEKIAFMSKARIDVSHPMDTITLPEGYRTAVAIPPVAVNPTIAIRKFTDVPNIDDLIKNGYFSKEAGEFFKAAIKSKRNMLIVGGMGTGKTTMIAIASKEFSNDEHTLLIEEVMEVPISILHLRRLIARPPSVEGKGEITLAHLLKQGLMMKPDRVIVSEVRDGAIFYMLQAMQVGHEGSLSTIHANSPREALFKRIPMMLSMSKEAVELSNEDKLSFAASALHLIVYLEQDPYTGKRYCAKISEVIEDPTIDVKDIFIRENGKMIATGHFPERCEKGAARYGIKYDRSWFIKK
ncbi:MAG: CpaF family protein [Tepidibacillus sp.]